MVSVNAAPDLPLAGARCAASPSRRWPTRPRHRPAHTNTREAGVGGNGLAATAEDEEDQPRRGNARRAALTVHD